MPPSPARAQRTWFQRLVLVVVIVVAIGGTLGFFVLSFGQVTGTEFTPDRFRRRDFAYFRIPLVRLQISPVVRWDSSNDLEVHLGRNALKQHRRATAKRWDVARVLSGTNIEIGDADILCQYLDTKNEEDQFLWLEWTKADEARAKPLWLAILEATRLDAYVCIPGLFELAESHDDVNELSDEINRYMSETLSSMADDRASLEQFERAEQLYTAALAYDEDHELLKSKVDALRRRLGKEVSDDAPPESTGS